MMKLPEKIFDLRKRQGLSQEALAERGVSITWSSAGSGVWVGEPVRADLPAKPDGNGHSGTLSVWCRGYDADGNLVCAYDPTA